MTDDAIDGTERVAREITAMLRSHIRDGAARHPRSLQKTIGPSEIGSPCDRRLAYTMLAWDTTNDDSDPLASIIGTATHTWLAETFRAIPGFHVERRVYPRGELGSGTADLYYEPLGAVLDWKVPGTTAVKRYAGEGLSQQYRVQTQLYGLGYANAGYDVNYVGCVIVPRSNARLSEMFTILEPYNPAAAHAALRRLDTVITLAFSLDLEHNPSGWEHLRTADAYCTYCPYFSPGSKDLSRGCPGDAGRTVRPTVFAGLLPPDAPR